MKIFFTKAVLKAKEVINNLIDFVYLKKDKGYTDLTEETYKTDFKVESDTSIVKAAYEKAWASKNFEIDNYWKRATYFWAFQVASFTAYMAFLSSNYYQNNPANRQLLFFIVCIGVITSLAWVLINIGSKFWQRNWEKHVDMLEDKITGPLYKTVYMYKNEVTFSVSKINEIVSRFFVFIWVMLGFKYVSDNIIFQGTWRDIAIYEITAIFFTLYFVVAMFYGHGRGRFGANKNFDFKRRVVFKNP